MFAGETACAANGKSSARSGGARYLRDTGSTRAVGVCE
jgi:hypothetical protein